jgi:hypothetical protein
MMMVQSGRFGAAAGPPFSSVVLLCGFEGTDGQTTYTDESSFARTLTNSGAQVDTAQFKFGVSSLLCTSNDYVRAADSADFEFGTGQFGVECWVRFSALSSTMGIISKGSNATTGPAWALIRLSTGELVFRMATNSTGSTFVNVSASPSLSTGQWYHVAADRDGGGVVRLYLDGAMIASTSHATALINGSRELYVGATSIGGALQDLNGWVDEARVIKGAAPYASDSGYTVPTAAFPRS